MEVHFTQIYTRPFFEIQLALARKVAEISQEPLERVLMRYTAFYRIFGLDWSLDPANSVWQAYIQELQQGVDKVDFTYQFYLQRYPAIPVFADEEHWGCFASDYNPQTQVIKIHFADQDDSAYGPLSHQRVDVRKAELRAMFREMRQRHPDAVLVRGGSWLYNWDSYRRLFPPAFGTSAHPQPMPALYGRAIWGQFLRRGWRVHEETITEFLQRVSQLERVEDYPQCFPYEVLLTEAPIQTFYEFYGV